MSLRERLALAAGYEWSWLKKRDRLDREYATKSGEFARDMVAQDKWHQRQARVDNELSRRIRRIRMMA